MDRQQALALVAAVALAIVHLFGAKLRFLEGVPRRAWLSVFGGVSVAYVFAHLLPELARGQEAVEAGEGADGPLLGLLEDHVYLMALAGLAVFYGIENHSLRSRRSRRAAGREERTGAAAFWVSIGSFAAYNVIVGYLLLRGELDDGTALALYTLAIGVHFVVNDIGLREHHKHQYERVGRWVVAAAVLVGWVVGVTSEISERAVAFVVAFLAGGIVLNVMKEELPRERQARFGPFLAGAVVYTVLLQAA